MYCRDASSLGGLATLARGSGRTELRGAAPSLERLAEALATAGTVERGGRVLVLARLQVVDEELSGVIALSDAMPLVVLAPHAQRLARRLLCSGARAALDAEADGEKIVAAVMAAWHGLLVMPAAAAAEGNSAAALAAAPEPLSPREIEILRLLAAGDSNKTIAARLSISVHTVKFHISSILAKLGVASRTEAVALGLRLGIVLL